MPAHNIDMADPKAIARLLLAVVIAGGGEIELPATTYDSLDKGRILLVDFDRATSKLVLSTSSEWGRAITVQPEAVAWSAPIETAPLERARVTAEKEAARSTVHSDEELAEMEENFTRRQQVARDVAKGIAPLRIKTLK